MQLLTLACFMEVFLELFLESVVLKTLSCVKNDFLLDYCSPVFHIQKHLCFCSLCNVSLEIVKCFILVSSDMSQQELNLKVLFYLKLSGLHFNLRISFLMLVDEQKQLQEGGKALLRYSSTTACLNPLASDTIINRLVVCRQVRTIVSM